MIQWSVVKLEICLPMMTYCNTSHAHNASIPLLAIGYHDVVYSHPKKGLGVITYKISNIFQHASTPCQKLSYITSTCYLGIIHRYFLWLVWYCMKLKHDIYKNIQSQYHSQDLLKRLFLDFYSHEIYSMVRLSMTRWVWWLASNVIWRCKPTLAPLFSMSLSRHSTFMVSPYKHHVTRPWIVLMKWCHLWVSLTKHLLQIRLGY